MKGRGVVQERAQTPDRQAAVRCAAAAAAECLGCAVAQQGCVAGNACPTPILPARHALHPSALVACTSQIVVPLSDVNGLLFCVSSLSGEAVQACSTTLVGTVDMRSFFII